MASDHRSRNTILTCVILLLSIILMMINHCEGSLSSSKRYADMCNGTMALCPTLVEEAEEFLMDNEEHRRILADTNKISYDALKKSEPACAKNCQGEKNYNAGDRQCLKMYYCH
ncbi:putative rapid ALkalinization Factor [Helianthus annuus]|nr:protein RALF-like 33 [Helianthus annuus]KAJ0450506.1 putative rapid ALkalinization Factor [Helianthus annuus]KAJ0472358.1 putative rapid ALkalinization Factor [Helianthus annuus]KAJ0647956.1 putative rapid ALkalinization Factor [Helianthus annuus]KAJ0651813.1 putative rapid ALkalinization Factor [Helianthus annuus]